MENIQRPIIVPWDFSQVAENAFEHALVITNVLNREIILLHIISEDKDLKEAQERMQKKCDELKAQYGVNTSSLVMTGNIFTSISQAALDYKAEMLVMGTHGIKGFQRFTGSRALRVIVSSKVPFVVIQEKPQKPKYENIVFPVDFRKETKEKVAWVSYLSKHFNSRFLVFKGKVSDSGFKKNIASNLLFVENFFKNNDIEYELHSAEGKKSFEKETVEFAKKMNADMILVLTTRDITFLDYLVAAKEQYVIANPYKLPVMCINPKPGKFASGFRATGG